MSIKRSHTIYRALVVLIVLILPLYSIFVMTPLFSDLIVSNLGGCARKSAKHISRMIVASNLLGPGGEVSPEFEAEAKKSLVDFDILKIKIYSIDGVTIYSSSADDIGKIYPDAAFWQKIKDGASYSKVVKNESFSVDKERFQEDVIETYFPLIRDNKMLGAMEIYTSIASQQKALASLSLKHYLMVLSILLLMGAMYFLSEEKEKGYRREQQVFQDQILSAKKEWEKTFDAIEDVISIVDLSFTIQMINKAGRARYNASFSELLGRKCFEVLDNSYDICPDCPIPRVLDDGNTHHSELHNPTTGQTFSVSVAPLFDEYGHVTGYVHTSRDITHQRIMEQQMQNSQRQESLAVLTKGIAHNFRNILASILMNSQVLQSNHGEDPQIMEITNWINDSVQAGSKLVTGLMQFAQQKANTEFQLLDLAQFIPDTYELLRSSVGKNVNLTYETPQSLEVMGDPGALLQVMTNICANAADAMPRGGDLKIRLLGIGSEALIIIADTGSGIDQSTLDKIFEPFFTTKPVDKGTGLGLSSSYGIIKEHGGDIKVESTPGIGTTVTIILPLTENGASLNQLTLMHDIEGFEQKILIIDDEEQAIMPMTILLNRAGYQTTSAKSCEEGLAKLNSWHPELVIIDYNMPGRNGIDCAREINQIDPSAKIIILSGITAAEIEERINEQGINFISCCLEKPIRITELQQAVAEALGRIAGGE